MGKIKKTNAMRILDQSKVDYHVIEYDASDGLIDGISVAKKVRKDPFCVYKTLVVQGASRELYVFIIPVSVELDLKKAAKAAGEKKLEMLPLKDLFKSTGYVKGGCSPIGMKRLYRTFLDRSAEGLDQIIVSGGKVGLQIELKVVDLVTIVQGRFADFVKE